ncbi:MAG: succinate dehydrogenase/fumarate reductase iron-sulfur subunit [Rhodospirillales bacterium]|nr:MAG: succinate dehydrogenase/fumarate reductase iron-sulfur subunit [Rhodospirillales bacterium]
MDELEIRVWRGAADGHYQVFRAPRRANQTVLDVVSWIQREADPSLSYRFACRVGVCGSCAMTVNGKPRWTCRTHITKVAKDGRLTIAPLRNLPVIRDLACDMAPFFEKWRRARGRFEAAISRDDPLVPISPDSLERRAADAAVECINCAVCHAACDVVGWRPDYLGPAALNRAWVAWNDLRDRDRSAVLRAANAGAGCGNCHSHQSCAEHCPVEINPTRSIAGLKRAGLLALLRGSL